MGIVLLQLYRFPLINSLVLVGFCHGHLGALAVILPLVVLLLDGLAGLLATAVCWVELNFIIVVDFLFKLHLDELHHLELFKFFLLALEIPIVEQF